MSDKILRKIRGREKRISNKSHIKIKTLISRLRFVVVAMLVAVSSLLGNLSNTESAHAAIGDITEYTIPTPWQPSFNPNELAFGPDGQIWHTGYQRIGKVTTGGSFTQYLRGSGINDYGIAAGADDNMWFGENGNVIKMSMSGTVLGTYSVPSGKTPHRMVLGPDDAVWFTMANSGYIGKITTSGTITEYAAISTVTDITVGPDGNLWFTHGRTGTSVNGVGKITTTGTVTLYTIPTPYNAWPQSITTGPDGNLWYTQKNSHRIGKITTSGVATDYNLPTSDLTQPYAITSGTDGSLWFTARDGGGGGGEIGRMNTSGTITDIYTAPTAGEFRDIISGDGAVWYTNRAGDKIGRVATELYDQTITFTSTAPTGAIVDGSIYTPTATSTSGLTVDLTIDSSSSGVCSMDGSGDVSFHGAGTCIVNANQSGDADYNPALQVQQSFEVLPVYADISVVVSCPSTVTVSAGVTCTVTVNNDGPAVARNVNLHAVFTDSFSGIVLTGGGTVSDQTINWSASSLAVDDPKVFTFEADAATASRSSFSAAVLQESPDPVISDNIDDAVVLITQ